MPLITEHTIYKFENNSFPSKDAAVEYVKQYKDRLIMRRDRLVDQIHEFKDYKLPETVQQLDACMTTPDKDFLQFFVNGFSIKSNISQIESVSFKYVEPYVSINDGAAYVPVNKKTMKELRSLVRSTIALQLEQLITEYKGIRHALNKCGDMIKRINEDEDIK
ncbi:MAG: hypothetical protein MJZ25_09210 [Fibrobacter sp.]|nr:hypothetical protein [Fibrobacter sp.]